MSYPFIKIDVSEGISPWKCEACKVSLRNKIAVQIEAGNSLMMYCKEHAFHFCTRFHEKFKPQSLPKD